MFKAFALFGSCREIIDTAAAARNIARQRGCKLVSCLAADQPHAMLAPLTALGLRAHGQIPSLPETGKLPAAAVTALEALVKKHQPGLLIAQYGTPAAALCQPLALRHGIELRLLSRSLRPLADCIRADHELALDLERQLPYIPPDHRLLLVYARNRKRVPHGESATCRAVQALASEPRCSVVFPVNKSPDIQDIVYEQVAWHEHIHLLEPLERLVFLHLLDKAQVVLTDSVHVANEAAELGRPVVFVFTDGATTPIGLPTGTLTRVANEAGSIEAAVRAMLAPPAGEQEAPTMLPARVMSWPYPLRRLEGRVNKG
ncbi:hypothetical protein E2F43_15030 [Seongchinamella unica]|uniref:UDP-N-acetylglucosamine 2-epimerase (non-hydrolyzing) n=1 Tax=Seongchinamella unica TaxID=2547392 RepID=A0A4R5LQQ5_9GAMM|nr:UDP-N-acetylglucosamine 2-epimerase [Seongchinamella unica]TDG12870.1 hypothetical protein E2F43_15030 [Seongchinamella unica]